LEEGAWSIPYESRLTGAYEDMEAGMLGINKPGLLKKYFYKTHVEQYLGGAA